MNVSSWRFPALCLLALMGLLGCSKDDALKPSPLPAFSRAVDVDRLWSADTGMGTDEQHYALIPAVDGRAIYAADIDGRLQARKRENGHRLWTINTGLPFSAGPVVAYNQVFLGTRKGEVLCFSAEDGELLWRAQLGGEVLALPAVNGDAVVVKSADGHVTLLDRVGGASRWVYDSGNTTLSLRISSRPMLLPDSVLIGTPAGEMLALNRASGQLLWQRRVAEPAGKSELDRLVDIAGDFVQSDGRLYVGTYQGRMAAMDLQSGQFVWQQPLSTFQPVADANGMAFAVDADSRVLAMRNDDGVVLWRNELLLGRRLTGVATLAHWLLIGDLDGWIHVINQSDGVVVGRHHMDGLARVWRAAHPLFATPVVDDDTVFALDSVGRLTAFRVVPRNNTVSIAETASTAETSVTAETPVTESAAP